MTAAWLTTLRNLGNPKTVAEAMAAAPKREALWQPMLDALEAADETFTEGRGGEFFYQPEAAFRLIDALGVLSRAVTDTQADA